VPLLFFDTDVWFKIEEDAEAGKCRIEFRKEKRGKDDLQ
jgi:hypothetical protein